MLHNPKIPFCLLWVISTHVPVAVMLIFSDFHAISCSFFSDFHVMLHSCYIPATFMSHSCYIHVKVIFMLLFELQYLHKYGTNSYIGGLY